MKNTGNTAVVNFRLPPKQKKAAAKFLRKRGISLSSYLRAVVFRLADSDATITNPETLAAMNDAANGKNLKSYPSADVAIDALWK